MNNFINRNNELQQLETEFQRPGASLIVLYGRRRLGKTALLREFAAEKRHCYFMADRAAEFDLRRSLAITMAAALDEPTLARSSYDSWYDLFAAFDRLRQRAPFILIFDEYQYLCQVQPAFSSYLQKWWDEHWKDSDITLVLCGSVTSMMYRETLASSAPLYGRSTCQILLKPISFQFLSDFLPDRSEEELVHFYSFTGGVPRYLELVAPYRTGARALKELVLHPNGVLHNEAKQLLQDEIQTPNICWSLLHAIGSGAHRISEIAGRLQEPANKLTRYLELLRDLCLVERQTPVLERTPGKSKKGIYVVSDPFCRLWFGAIYPYSSFFEFGEIEPAYKRIHPLIESHTAGCFEDICRNWIQKRALEFDAVRVGRQWSAQYDIDVAAVNPDGQLTVIGECKWSKKQVGVSVLNDLDEKAADNRLPLAESCTRILFSRSGFTDELRQTAEGSKCIRLVRPQDLA